MTTTVVRGVTIKVWFIPAKYKQMKHGKEKHTYVSVILCICKWLVRALMSRSLSLHPGRKQ